MIKLTRPRTLVLIPLLFSLHSPWAAGQTPPAPFDQNPDAAPSENQFDAQPRLTEELARLLSNPRRARFLHFPKGHSVGLLLEQVSIGGTYQYVRGKGRMSVARGDVFVPLGVAAPAPAATTCPLLS